MQVRNRATGEVVDLPDGTPDDAIHGHFSGGAAPAQPQGLAQSFMSAGQQVVPQLAAQLAAPQQQSTLPNIGGGAVVGLTPQQAQFTLQSAQQSNVDSMQQRMEQQRQTQQSLESEKDRSQQLKLHKENLKNIIQERKIQADRDKFEAEVRAEEGNLNRGLQEKLANIDKTLAEKRITQDATQFDKGYSLQEKSQGLDARRVAIAESGLELDRKQMEQQGWEIRTMAYQGKNVLAAFKAGEAPRIMGDAPLDGSEKPITKQDKSYQDNIMKATQSISESEGLSFYEAHIMAQAAVSQGMGLKAFDNDSERLQFVMIRGQQLRDAAVAGLPSGAQNNQEIVSSIEDRSLVDAEIESYRANGLVSWQDPDTGEVKWYDPNEANDSE